MSELPKMLYRSGSEIVWDGRKLDTLIVNDAAEFEDARAAGWLEAADVASLDDEPDASSEPSAPIKRPYTRKAAVADAPAA